MERQLNGKRRTMAPMLKTILVDDQNRKGTQRSQSAESFERVEEMELSSSTTTYNKRKVSLAEDRQRLGNEGGL
jgi:hypothetical protein